MKWQAVSFDWNQVRAFLATAEEGSLSAAARALQATQPTLSRQVSALEQDLGVTLFEALTGSPPFQATSIPDLCQRIRAVPAPPLRNLRPDVPEKLQQVILRCFRNSRHTFQH